MSAITWVDVTAHASNLSTVDEFARADILSLVNVHFNPALFGGEEGARLRLLRIYLACHMATYSQTAASGGGSGAVISESEGGLSRTYAQAAVTSTYGSTAWGSMVQELLRASPARAGVLLG